MSLAQAIHELSFQGLNRRRVRYKRLEKAVHRIEQKAEGLEVPDDIESFDYTQAFIELAGGTATRRQVKRLAAGGLSQIAQRSDGNELVQILLSAVDGLGRSLLKSLLIGYLICRDTDSKVLQYVRRFLYERQAFLPTMWRERVQRYHLLSADVGSICSRKILEAETYDASTFGNESGLRGVKASGGVGYVIFRELSNQLAAGHSEAQLLRYLDYVRVDGEIRFASHIQDYANALLKPYLKVAADETIRAHTEQFLLHHFGDPRINPGAWKSVPSAQIEVMKQWLAKASLELLLSVVSASNDTQQWEQRSEFWNHYFDQGLVSDAWVALGPTAAYEARRLVNQGELASTAAFGVLEGGGVQSDHSVLIFRIGDFVISEWTHSGKVRIYDIANRHCPSFYQRTYNTTRIRSDRTCNVAVIHNTRWRERVSGFIKFELGVAPPRSMASISLTKHCQNCKQSLHILWFENENSRHCSRCRLKANYV